MKNLMNKYAGFTLAEVLITLGIIGVVAAITLPTLIQKYQVKVLETGFKKSYSVAQNAYMMTKSKLGMSNLRSYYAYYDSTKKTYPNLSEFYNAFYESLNGQQVNYKGRNEYSVYQNYSGTEYSPQPCDTNCPHITRTLADGSGIGVLINSAEIFISIDTNGIKKGPNRMGFDAFIFYVQNDKLLPVKPKDTTACNEDKQSNSCILSFPCSAKLTKQSNGLGCSYFALNDINPDDETKSYWANLPK